MRHHLDPVNSLESFNPTAVALQPVGQVYELTATGSRLDRSPLSETRLAKGFEVSAPIRHFGLFDCGPSATPRVWKAKCGLKQDMVSFLRQRMEERGQKTGRKCRALAEAGCREPEARRDVEMGQRPRGAPGKRTRGRAGPCWHGSL